MSVIANHLEQIAAELEASSRDQKQPRSERFRHRRYAPFVRELALRDRFCRELAAVDIGGDMPPEDACQLVWPLLGRYRFPRNEPTFFLEDWAVILAAARLGKVNALPKIRTIDEIRGGAEVEVQFAYVGSLVQDHPPSGLWSPVVEPVGIFLDRGTDKQLRRQLRKACRRPLRNFLGRLGELAHIRHLPSFDVRLLSYTREEGGPYDPDALGRVTDRSYGHRRVVSADFRVAPRDRELEDVLEEVLNGLMAVLRDIVEELAQGRWPDYQNDARWWARTVFDGLTLRMIVKEEAMDDTDAISLEPQIKTALRRMGITGETK